MTKEKINKDMIIGEVMEKHPETIAVFRKHFHTAGCLTCPGSDREDIAFGAMMHDANADRLVRDLNAAIELAEGGGARGDEEKPG